MVSIMLLNEHLHFWSFHKNSVATTYVQKYTVSEKDCTLFLFFIFFLVAQCVESGVSCTDCY